MHRVVWCSQWGAHQVIYCIEAHERRVCGPPTLWPLRQHQSQGRHARTPPLRLDRRARPPRPPPQQAKAFEEGLAALAKQALQNDPEAAAQLRRYEEAVVRLEKAKAAEKELEKIFAVRRERAGWRTQVSNGVSAKGCVSCRAAALGWSSAACGKAAGGVHARSTRPARAHAHVKRTRAHVHTHPRRTTPPLPSKQDAAKAAIQEDVAAEADTKARASQLMADAEVAAAEKLLRAAQIEYEIAADEKARIGAAAFSDADRAESGKAAAAAVAGGLVATLPFALAAGGASELLSLADTAACCALFGVTYRCARAVGRSGPRYACM